MDMSGVDLGKVTNWLQVINTLPSLVQLHLSGCQLSNTYLDVPSLNLTSLTLLDLSNNNFSSFLPQWIFSITTLVSLDLTRCNFLDLLPSSTHSFRNLTSLRLLHVAENDFMKSSLVLKELSSSNLFSLDISSCDVSSSLLNSLHNLTSLRSLYLSSNRLIRIIPKSLGNFCKLRVIDLADNKLSGISLTNLLESFFECKSPVLESLYLSGNNINGTIPRSIEQLSFLRHLDLHSNQISGPIPYSIGQLSYLDALDLSENKLNGTFPESIGRLASLKTLDFSSNRIEGNLPHSFGQLSNLVYLICDDNLLMGVVTEAHFANLVSLKVLYGSGNNLSLRLHAADWSPPFQLVSLYLDSWVLGPQFPLWLQSQTYLKVLGISNTGISSPIPDSFLRSFPNLYSLDMSKNHIQGTLALLGIRATIEKVDLSSNKFRGSLDYFLCSDGVKETKNLNLGNNLFSGVIPECWEKWSNLEILNLENNNLSGEIPKTLGLIPALQLLNMGGNKVSGRLPSSLMNLTRLEFLQLGRNELQGSIPAWIGTKLTLLILLNLRSNNFSENIPHELCYLTHVQIMDLAHNRLSGNIPRCFNNFSVLSGKYTNSIFSFFSEFEYGLSIASDTLVMKGREDTYNGTLPYVMLLDLSSNNLVGHIPSELSSLVKINFLNLSRNQLIGRIPNKIGDMKELISCDLSMNKLSGELPVSLSMLSSLSSFNVSYNNLTGRIPTSTQLQSFDEYSFFHNKLCGAPLIETNDCVRAEVTNATKEDIMEDNERDWGLIISIVLGFFTGFWLIVGPLVVITSRGTPYSHLLRKWIK